MVLVLRADDLEQAAVDDEARGAGRSDRDERERRALDRGLMRERADDRIHERGADIAGMHVAERGAWRCWEMSHTSLARATLRWQA